MTARTDSGRFDFESCRALGRGESGTGRSKKLIRLKDTVSFVPVGRRDTR
jgi:hypothetical protein